MCNKQTKRHPGVGLALLGAVSLAVLAAACLWLQMGWRSCQATLVDLAGDADKLMGFTAPAAVLDGTDVQYVTLRDGRLENAYQLDEWAGPLYAESYVWVEEEYAIAPAVRDEVNAELTFYTANGETLCRGTAQAFCQMLTINLPDNTSLRLPLGTVQTTEPVEIRGWADAWLDFASDTMLAETTAASPYRVGQTPLRLGSDWGIAWGVEAGGYRPGLYRVTESLSDTEISALPADGFVGESPVLCTSTPYGSMEPFYCPAEAREVLTAFDLGDGLAMLYLDGEDQLCVDLVDAAGQCTDRLALQAPAHEAQGIGAGLMPRQTTGEAVVLLQSYLSAETRWEGMILALRADGGRLTLAEQTAVADIHILWRTMCAVLNESGTALLTIRSNLTVAESQYGSEPWCSGYLVEVWPLGSTEAVYQGFLDIGLARDGGAVSRLTSPNRLWEPYPLHQTVFLTLAADRGKIE